jgi:hypothetical protein
MSEVEIVETKCSDFFKVKGKKYWTAGISFD